MEIVYKEKPEYISWDDIHNVLWASHSINRNNGVFMSYPSLSGEELQKKITLGSGKIFVALDNYKIVGTSAYTIVKSSYWFCKDFYIYECLSCVLPEYTGKGIHKTLNKLRFKEAAKENGPLLCVCETHIANYRKIKIALSLGYKIVSYKLCSDGHINVIIAKWPNDCPYSNLFINIMRFFAYMYAYTKKFYRKFKMK